MTKQEQRSGDAGILKQLLRRLDEDEAYWQAQAVAKHLVELVQDDPEAWYLYGRVQARLGEHAAAVWCLNKALEIGGPSVEIAAEMCYIDGVRGDLKGAIEWCRRALELAPADAGLHGEMARLLALSGDADEAIRILEICLRMPGLEPDDAKAVRTQLGRLLMRLRRYDDALVQFRAIAGAGDTDDSTWADIGHCLSRLGKMEEAIEAFERAVKILPDAHNLYNLGDAFLGNGQPEKAIEHLEGAARIKPEMALARYNLGLAYYELGRFEEAASEARAAIAADPDMRTAEMNLGLSAMTNLGLSLMRQEKYEEAVQTFKKNEKQFAATYYNMGLALYRAERYPEALDYFKRACAIEPDDAEYLDLLGQTYDVLGKYAIAEKHLRRAIELAPNYPDSCYDLGNMFLKFKDKRAEAKTLLERAVELNPEMMWGYYCLGCWHALEGQKGKAFEYLEKAIEKGFKKRDWMEADKDLDALRGDPRYAKVLAKFKKKSGEEAGEEKKANQAKKAKKAAAKGK